jgi:hypothetical protein
MQMDPKTAGGRPESGHFTAKHAIHRHNRPAHRDQITETRPEDGLPQRKTERMTQATYNF